ncbi:hypothetical protein TNCV_1448181 [Trichonephila clavipes]|nr:hypothetical protein TNCV_1448181 [Trichonephila clavipes]
MTSATCLSMMLPEECIVASPALSPDEYAMRIQATKTQLLSSVKSTVPIHSRSSTRCSRHLQITLSPDGRR